MTDRGSLTLVRFALTTLGVVFVTDLGVMLLLHDFLVGLDPLLWAFVYSFVLLLLVSPVVLYVVARRRDAEEQLLRSEAEYRALFEHATYGMYRSTPEGKFIVANPALVEMLGYESEAELLKVDLARDVYASGEERDVLVEQYRAVGKIGAIEPLWSRKDGQRITVQLSGRPVRNAAGALECFEMIVADVTEQRALEVQLRQAQKMDAVGRLAGGIAHDFNNLLTIISGECQMALQRLDEQSPLHDSLCYIQNAGERAAALTRQLLAFSRKQPVEATVFNLNDLVTDTEPMLRRLIGEDIEFTVRKAPDLGSLKADRGQIEQVLTNLVVNARDAMPEGGDVVIETGNATVDEAGASSDADAAPLGFVTVAVIDTGMGMSDEVQARLFEPFFTTKGEGGTGLGLGTSYGIVAQAGGHIKVASAPGAGTTMTVYLPCVPDEAAAPESEQVGSIGGGTETILLVEDEEDVRRVAAGMLRAQGYTVVEAGSGDQALRILEDRGRSVELLLTDVVMPGMGGRVLAEWVRAAWPKTRILFATGYTDDETLKRQLLDREVMIVHKPYTMQSLGSKVRSVLDGFGPIGPAEWEPASVSPAHPSRGTRTGD